VEAAGLLGRFLFEERGDHRITIDPSAAKQHAIPCYRKISFQPVGVMRQYERGADGRFHNGLLIELTAKTCRHDQLKPPPSVGLTSHRTVDLNLRAATPGPGPSHTDSATPAFADRHAVVFRCATHLATAPAALAPCVSVVRTRA